MPKLRDPNLRQQKFIDAYLKTGNATEAALAAGYKCRSRAVAQSIGSENLLKPMIAARLAQRRAEISAQTGITVESVQNRLLAEAELASQEGKRSAAVAAYGTLLKSIGGMTGDRPHPDSIVGKALDAKKAEDLRAAIDRYYAEKYLAQPPAKQVQSSVKEVAEGPGEGDIEAERGDSVEATLSPPMPPVADSTTVQLSHTTVF